MEWRAGTALLGSSMILLALLIVLILTKMDTGLELEGSLRQTRHGWVLSVQVPANRMNLVSRCQSVRLSAGGKQDWYAVMGRMHGQWHQDRQAVMAQLEIPLQAAPWAAATDSSAQIVQAMLIEKQGMPVLKVLFDSVLPKAGS